MGWLIMCLDNLGLIPSTCRMEFIRLVQIVVVVFNDLDVDCVYNFFCIAAFIMARIIQVWV